MNGSVMPTRVSRLSGVIVAVLATLLRSSAAGGQVTCSGRPGCSMSIAATLTNTYVARLVLSSATTTLVAPTAASFGSPAGVNSPTALTLTVKSNATHTISVAAAAAVFSGGSGIKPASALRYTTDGFATLKGVSGAGSALVAGAAPTAGTAHAIGYNTTYAWLTDTPGAYSLGITYTLTAP